MQLQVRILDGFDHRHLVRFPSSHNARAHGNWRNSPPLQFLNKLRTWCRSEQLQFAGRWDEQNTAIFGDNPVKQREINSKRFEIPKLTTTDENDPSPSG